MNNYSITFKSLRDGITYTVNIGGGTGAAIPLIGCAKPFVTQEDDTEDIFIPIRTQSGYIRVIDDGSFDWKDLVPATDTDRPVTLTGEYNGTTVVYWQGFMQAQNFSGTLYGNPQEREFPVQCALSALSAVQAPINYTEMKNLAYLVRYIFQQMPSAITFNRYVFQGGTDARKWLQKIFDWQNFLTTDDNGLTSRYSLYQVLEDVCRFWGWTCRTWRQQVIFTCADDIMEQNALVLNATTLGTLADDTTGSSTAGTVEAMFTTKTAGNIFATTDVVDTKVRGISTAEVKADCNKASDLLQFAPQSVRNTMEAGGYTWVQQGDDSLVGYFTTPEITVFDSEVLTGSVYSASYGGYCRRQIYSEKKDTDANVADMIMVKHVYDNGVALCSLATKRPRIFSGGSLRMSGQIFVGSAAYTTNDQPEKRNMLMRVGIGPDYNHAKWFYLYQASDLWIYNGWGSTRAGSEFRVKTNLALCYSDYLIGAIFGDFPTIPVDDDMYGKLFVDFCGCDDIYGISDNFQIANFRVEYSRDSASLIGERTRTIQKDRQTTQTYKATNLNKGEEKWYADCIFASDNNMEYGYGLLMNPSGMSANPGKFMTTVDYGTSPQFPEQHLAARVTSYWANAKRMVQAPLLSNGLCGDVAARDISPRHKLTIDNTTCHPIAVSQDWCDDITNITLLQV